MVSIKVALASYSTIMSLGNDPSSVAIRYPNRCRHRNTIRLDRLLSLTLLLSLHIHNSIGIRPPQFFFPTMFTFNQVGETVEWVET